MELRKARRLFDELFRRYESAFKAFTKISYLFLFSLMSLGIAAVFGLKLPLGQSLAWSALVIAAIVAAAWWISISSCPSPTLLCSLDYLFKAFPNLHPESLIDLLGLGLALGSQRPKGVASLYLSSEIPILDYKYFIVISSQDQAEWFQIYLGTASKNRRALHARSPEYTRYLVEVGSVDTEKLAAPELPLGIHLHAFIPQPLDWIGGQEAPCTISQDLLVFDGPGPGWLSLAKECSHDRRDRLILFQRTKRLLFESWKIRVIDSDKAKSGWELRRLLSEHQAELEDTDSALEISNPAD